MLNEFVILAAMFTVAEPKIEGKVVKGDLAHISHYAHSVYLFINIKDSGEGYICGSSVINQKILLTAAHCFEDCFRVSCSEGVAYSGHSHRYMGQKTRIRTFLIHEKYNKDSVHNDIGLVLVQSPLRLGELVKRVSIRRGPTQRKVATLAGWGMIDDDKEIFSDYLHYATLKLWTSDECRKIMTTLPEGCICAGHLSGEKYPSQGDSGSALIVDEYIQIGVVSYMRPDISRSVVAFTDVSYYYDWIKEATKELYCS